MAACYSLHEGSGKAWEVPQSAALCALCESRDWERRDGLWRSDWPGCYLAYTATVLSAQLGQIMLTQPLAEAMRAL